MRSIAFLCVVAVAGCSGESYRDKVLAKRQELVAAQRRAYEARERYSFSTKSERELIEKDTQAAVDAAADLEAEVAAMEGEYGRPLPPRPEFKPPKVTGADVLAAERIAEEAHRDYREYVSASNKPDADPEEQAQAARIRSELLDRSISADARLGVLKERFSRGE